MLTIINQPEDTFLNGWTLLLGAGLTATPWYLGYATEPLPTRSGAATGMLIAILALLALRQTFEWEEIAIAVVGLWACGAPWILGSSGHNAATWAHAGFGLAAIIAAGAEIWGLHDSPDSFET